MSVVSYLLISFALPSRVVPGCASHIQVDPFLGLTALAVDPSVLDVTATMGEAKAEPLEVFPGKRTQRQRLARGLPPAVQ